MSVSSAASGVSLNQTSLKGFAQQRRHDAEAQPSSLQPADVQGVQQNAGKGQVDLKEQGVDNQHPHGDGSDMPARKHAGSDAASALAVSAYASMSMGFQATSSISAEA